MKSFEKPDEDQAKNERNHQSSGYSKVEESSTKIRESKKVLEESAKNVDLTSYLSDLLKHRKSKPTPIRITSLNFADFIVSNGLLSISIVRNKKRSSGTGWDYWVTFKANVKKLHKNEITLEQFKSMSESVYPKYKSNYQKVVNLYLELINVKNYDYFLPPTSKWVFKDLGVTVTPDLGLIHEGKKSLVILYVRNDELGKRRADSLLALMEHEFYSLDPQFNYWILDVKHRKLHIKDSSTLISMPDLETDALRYIELWNRL